MRKLGTVLDHGIPPSVHFFSAVSTRQPENRSPPSCAMGCLFQQSPRSPLMVAGERNGAELPSALEEPHAFRFVLFRWHTFSAPNINPSSFAFHSKTTKNDDCLLLSSVSVCPLSTTLKEERWVCLCTSDIVSPALRQRVFSVNLKRQRSTSVTENSSNHQKCFV